MKSVISQIWLNLKNIPGWNTKRKILLIEADDYGSIRMPSLDAYNKLLPLLESKGKVSRYEKYDSMENENDLSGIFKILKKYKDKNGSHAKITPFCNVANPDFQGIKESDFSEYKYHTYKETIKHYKISESIYDLWDEGIKDGFFSPQFHGREHLNVQLFMKYLQLKNKDVLEGFEKEFCHVSIDEMNDLSRSFRASFYFDDKADLSYLGESISDGVLIFTDTFGYPPKVFCPSNGVFHDDLKFVLVKNNINTIVESGVRYHPLGNGKYKKKRYIFGSLNKAGQISYSRNCIFEPIRDGIENSVNIALRGIGAAFRWNKPAVIATHRVNFSGAIHPYNRENGLKALDNLLCTAIKKWPNIEFINSGEFSDIIHEPKY